MNTSIRKSSLRQVAAGLLLATLALRAVVPLGYMPGKILDGEFMVLCPVASAAAIELLPASSSHEHHHEDSADELPSIGIACPIGSSLFFDAIPHLAAPVAVSKQAFPVPQTHARDGFVEFSTQPYLARGPPKS